MSCLSQASPDSAGVVRQPAALDLAGFVLCQAQPAPGGWVREPGSAFCRVASPSASCVSQASQALAGCVPQPGLAGPSWRWALTRLHSTDLGSCSARPNRPHVVGCVSPVLHSPPCVSQASQAPAGFVPQAPKTASWLSWVIVMQGDWPPPMHRQTKGAGRAAVGGGTDRCHALNNGG